jgi:tetratricopeptide (TPR) repeat protein
MRRFHVTAFLILAGWLCFAPTAQSAEKEDLMTRTFIDGVRHYEVKDYQEAIEAFKSVADSGVRNGKLYFDLGNAYLKSGAIGPAILWYERAAALIPSDPDLQFNLTYARSLIKDENEEAPSPVWQVLFFWKDLFSLETFQWAAIGFNALFWLFLGFYRIFGRATFRHACYGLLVFSVLTLGTAGWRMIQDTCCPHAVILPAAVSVHSGFSPESTTLFVLHEGTRVAVEKQRENFLKIRFSKDKIGWIPRETAGLI